MAYEGFDYYNTTTTALLHVYGSSSIPSAPAINGAVGGWAGDWKVARRSTGSTNGTIPGYNVNTVNSPGYTNGTYDLITSGTTAIGGRGDADIAAGRPLQVSTGGSFGCSSSGGALATNFLIADCPTGGGPAPSNGNSTASRIGRPGSTIWVSLLARKESTTGEFVFAFHDNSSNVVDYDDASNTGTYLALTTAVSAGVPIWTVRDQGTVAASTASVSATDWTLLVMSIAYTGTVGSAPTGATISLFVNPALGVFTPPVTPDATLTVTGDYGFNAIAYYDETISDSGIDEIRLGESFTSVVPASNKIKVVGGLCTGTLNSNIFVDGNFGGITGVNEQIATAPQYTNPTAVTFKTNTAPWNGIAPGYNYVFDTDLQPNDGNYTISTGVRNLFGVVPSTSVPVWVSIPDRSGSGFMMVVNASYPPGLFYEQTPSNSFCDNSRYEFSVEVFNVLSNTMATNTNPGGSSVGDPCNPVTEPGCQQMSARNGAAPNWMGAASNNCGGCKAYHINPDIEFLIDDVVVYSPPGPVPNDEVWHKYGFSFKTKPGVTSLKLGIRNKAPGGNGNDLALDNFSFTPCVGSLTTSNNFPQCNPVPQIQVATTPEFDTPVYQWQMRRGAGAWTDISGATSATYNVASPVVQDDFVRVLVANSSGVMTSRNLNCMAVSGQIQAQCILPLPVTLLSFRAQKTTTGIQINWQTISETSSDVFRVERSVDGIHFETICTVPAQGYSNTLHSYFCMDTHPASGTNYYRLAQVDKNGQTGYSTVVQVKNDSPTEHLLTVVPNPAKDKVTVSIGLETNTPQKATLRLTTMLGQLIRQETVVLGTQTPVELHTESLAEGIYMLEVLTKQQKFIQKLIIQP